jgi:uncharacterized protein
MDHNYEHWIETYTGHPIDPLNPEPKRIYHHDIAHALSNQCRFSGHTQHFYSVAQHSVLVAALVKRWGADQRVQILALYHDASEAYLQDMPTPIKRQMPIYREAEAKLQKVIEDTLFPEFSGDGRWRRDAEELIKKADLILLATEARDLMNDPKDWKVLEGVVPLKTQISPLSPPQAKEAFIAWHGDLVIGLATRAVRK